MEVYAIVLTPETLATAIERLIMEETPQYWTPPDDRARRFQRHLAAAEPKVMHLLHRLAPNRDIAADAYQNASVRAWRAFDQYDPANDFVAWVCTIARHELAGIMRLAQTKNHGRNVSLHGDDVLHVFEMPAPEPDDATATTSIDDVLRLAIAAGVDITTTEAEILRRRATGAKVKDIADATGLTYGAAKTRLYRVVAHLRFLAATGQITIDNPKDGTE